MIGKFLSVLRAFFANEHPVIGWVLLGCVFVFAAWLRTLIPNLPISDPDSWGYLYPALSEMAGQGFQQTHGRGIAYPLFLLVTLEFFRDFYAISKVQHALGIISGIVWWAIWIEWRSWLPDSARRTFWLQCIGLVFLSLYLWNANAILFEEWIRPEAIFPILALAQTYFCLLYARARWASQNPLLMLFAGGMAILLAPICISTKPSWGFSAFVPIAIIFLGLFGKGMWKGLLPRIAPLVLGVILALAWSKLLPPAVGWIPDERSKSFLPATLFTVHAPTIAKVIERRVEIGRTTEEEVAFLKKWKTRIEESKNREKTSYKILDHDPDYLFYHSDAIANLPGATLPKDARDYMLSAYLDSVLMFPLDITLKVAKQLRVSFSDLTKTLYRRHLNWRDKLPGSIRSMDFYQLPKIDDDLAESYRKVRSESEQNIRIGPEKLHFGPSVNKFLLLGLGPAYLGFWMIGLPLIAAFASRNRNSSNSSDLTKSLWIFGILWATCMGTTLTVAVVHSFDIDRYLHILSAQHSLIIASSISILFVYFSKLKFSVFNKLAL
jgi:hypothetical protein